MAGTRARLAHPFRRGGRRRDIVLAAGLKLIAMPVVAWAAGTYLFHLSTHDVLAATLLLG